MIKIIFYIIVIVFAVSYFFPSDKEEIVEKNQDEIRLENASSSGKACVNTLGRGVYRDKSLYWKLDTCNVPN